jgi:hypothetical protein
LIILQEQKSIRSFFRPELAPALHYFTSEKVRISGAPLIQEYLPKEPCTGPDSPDLMPDRQGFPKNGTVSASGDRFHVRN